MNPRTVLTTLPLLFCVAVAGAQMTALNPPPLKKGLWQSTVTMQMGGLPNMPAGAAGPLGKPTTRQYCMEPGSWQKGMTSSQQAMQKMNCTMSNLEQDTHHFAFDQSCSGQGGMSMTMHVQMAWDGDTNVHGTSTSKMTGPQFPQGMTMDMTIDSKFMGADCGGLQPGQSKPMTQ
jgi:hypothetical protein